MVACVKYVVCLIWLVFNTIYSGLTTSDLQYHTHKRTSKGKISDLSYRASQTEFYYRNRITDVEATVKQTTYNAVLNAESELIFDVRSFHKYFNHWRTRHGHQTNKDLRSNSLI